MLATGSCADDEAAADDMITIKIDANTFDALSERERTILVARRLTDEPRSLQELADEYNISRQRVAQIERAAVKKLRAILGGKAA